MSTTEYQLAQDTNHETASAQTTPQPQQADHQQWPLRATPQADENPYLSGVAPTPPSVPGSDSGGDQKPRKIRLAAAVALAAGALVLGGVGGSVITHAVSGSSSSTQVGPGSGGGFSGGGPGGGGMGNSSQNGTTQQGGSGGGNSGTSQNGNTTTG